MRMMRLNNDVSMIYGMVMIYLSGFRWNWGWRTSFFSWSAWQALSLITQVKTISTVWWQSTIFRIDPCSSTFHYAEMDKLILIGGWISLLPLVIKLIQRTIWTILIHLLERRTVWSRCYSVTMSYAEQFEVVVIPLRASVYIPSVGILIPSVPTSHR